MNSYIKKKYHQQNISDSCFLITGGAGFIGSNLAHYLIHHGAKRVKVLDNLATGNYKNIEPLISHPSFEFIEGDICDFDTCTEVMQGVDYVSHQAALGSVPRSINNPIATNRVNVDGFLNVIEAAKNAKVKRMVYASSSSIYGDSKILPKVEENIGKPLSPYAITKATNELYASTFSLHYGFHTIGLRYFNVFGPLQDPKGAYAAVIPLFFTAALEGRSATLNGQGDQTRDFTFIGNVLQANIKAMLVENLSSHEACNIAYGERIGLKELWRRINNMLDKNIEPVYGPPRAGDVQDSLADVSKANRVFGYTPEYDLDKGLAQSVEFYKELL
ncbi:SDR family oxidoreductase [Pelobium manganitolerans]|uniref:SDR family oxidoreductase n=1 Tax=Pelobium manganitolerans TaxID=1842495 RepID=UPI003FA3A278